MNAPAWLEAWTAGKWTDGMAGAKQFDSANEDHRAWFRGLPPASRELFLRFPPGAVVRLKPHTLPRSLEEGALALWRTGHGIVCGYIEPTPELVELGIPEGGALFLLESPDPDHANQGIIGTAEVDEAVGYLKGYGPEQARANCLDEHHPECSATPDERDAWTCSCAGRGPLTETRFPGQIVPPGDS